MRFTGFLSLLLLSISFCNFSSHAVPSRPTLIGSLVTLQIIPSTSIDASVAIHTWQQLTFETEARIFNELMAYYGAQPSIKSEKAMSNIIDAHLVIKNALSSVDKNDSANMTVQQQLELEIAEYNSLLKVATEEGATQQSKEPFFQFADMHEQGYQNFHQRHGGPLDDEQFELLLQELFKRNQNSNRQLTALKLEESPGLLDWSQIESGRIQLMTVHGIHERRISNVISLSQIRPERLTPTNRPWDIPFLIQHRSQFLSAAESSSFVSYFQEHSRSIFENHLRHLPKDKLYYAVTKAVLGAAQEINERILLDAKDGWFYRSIEGENEFRPFEHGVDFKILEPENINERVELYMNYLGKPYLHIIRDYELLYQWLPSVNLLEPHFFRTYDFTALNKNPAITDALKTWMKQGGMAPLLNKKIALPIRSQAITMLGNLFYLFGRAANCTPTVEPTAPWVYQLSQNIGYDHENLNTDTPYDRVHSVIDDIVERSKAKTRLERDHFKRVALTILESIHTSLSSGHTPDDEVATTIQKIKTAAAHFQLLEDVRFSIEVESIRSQASERLKQLIPEWRFDCNNGLQTR